ncbi:MAG: hypothetical protein EAZ55_10670 [Cytophagales bacterium]|nr:MAG: hypothetical protein EAZ55_10670 [Cytophagales bacterium]
MKNLWTVSLRQQAIFIPKEWRKNATTPHLRSTTAGLVANLSSLGFGVAENLLKVLNELNPKQQLEILEHLKQATGVDKNWTPLVKGWDVPTGENYVDHLMTFFANLFGARGTQLRCGHTIPAGTFPLERYNGCPFCGTPFEIGKIEYKNQGSNKKILTLWTEKELYTFFEDLLGSKTALDATQMDSLQVLLSVLTLPKEINIGMKETLVAVIDIYKKQNMPEKAQALFGSPTDILRYLWYKHTGFFQIIEPATLIRRKTKAHKHLRRSLDTSAQARLAAVEELQLKYSRQESIIVAQWLNGLSLTVEKICEAMHPKRSMWVRFIRALRLTEYAKRKGFEKLNRILDVFYRQDYTVWQAHVNHFRLRSNEERTFQLLKQRPGLFARSLFSNMLWFGETSTIEAFKEVVDKVPARLLFTLNMYAENYFNPQQMRIVKPLGGVAKRIAPHSLLSLYDEKQRLQMQDSIADLCLLAMKKRFSALSTKNRTIYIHPQLFKIPVSIGDRSENVQDLPSALLGTVFPVEGDTVRLFMQWGNGMPAQHLDMDLSCRVAYSDGHLDICSFSQLTTTGCKHSGDIRSIPHKVGTAEYIDLNINELRKAKAKYVAFTCNAYSQGALALNMVVGWMNSKHPMRISEKTGVAYDPSCVQHQVRITNPLNKGLLFGVLLVESREIIWLEMPFGGQLVQNLDVRNVEAILAKISSKLNIGNLLLCKADAQKLALVEKPEEADESYDLKWAINTAAVTKLLVD